MARRHFDTRATLCERAAERRHKRGGVKALGAVRGLSMAKEYPRADRCPVECSVLFSHVLPGFCLLPMPVEHLGFGSQRVIQHCCAMDVSLRFGGCKDDIGNQRN